MKKARLLLLGIAALFLTACTVGVSSNCYIDKDNPISEDDSITPLTVTFDFNGGTYNDSPEQVTFNDVKPTSYWKYVKARLTGTITPPAHKTFEGFSFAEDDSSIIQDSYVVKEDIIVYAQYKAIPEVSCLVKWVDSVTSETITTETYFKNDMPKFKGTIPYHDDITFNHWEPAIHAITQEDIAKGTIDYKAIYIPIKTICTVTLDYYGDGLEKHTQTVLNGECAVEPKITKEGYKLDKWEYVSGGEGEFKFNTKITEDIEIKAIWEESVSTYTVTWLNYDGTILKRDTEVKEGEPPEAPSDNPKRQSLDPFVEYAFNNWVPSVSEEVHSNQTYVATYQPVFYENTEAYMHINIVDDNKDFTFTCTAESNITVDWGDGTPQQKYNPTSEISHTYETIGEYNVRILNPITTIGIPIYDNTLINDLYIGKEVTTIGKYAFSGCSQLQTVTFEPGSKLTSISGSAFKGCSVLTNITIPSGVTSIGDSAFNGCSALINITIPSGVTSIDASTFGDCSQLQTVTFEEGSKLTSIGEFAFNGCSVLTNITIPSGVTSIDKSSFENCSQLQTVTFEPGSKLTSIGRYAFYNCSAFTNITIPSGVTSIDVSTFERCSKLQTITFGEGSQLTLIDKYAFYNCSALTNITIPSGVTSIGFWAFRGCSALTNITIPSGVTSIGDAAFSGCSQLQTVDLTTLNTPPTLGIQAFDNCSSDLKLYVNLELVETFKTAEGWKDYKDHIFANPVPSSTNLITDNVVSLNIKFMPMFVTKQEASL